MSEDDEKEDGSWLMPIKSSTHVVQSIFEVILNTRHFTEYFASFVIALLPFVLVLVRIATSCGKTSI
jgi:hypothetical protein